jgi:hypothetical protein
MVSSLEATYNPFLAKQTMPARNKEVPTQPTRQTWQEAAASANVSEALAAFIVRFAERHQVVPGGAQIWEGRCCFPFDGGPEWLGELIPEMKPYWDFHFSFDEWTGPPPGYEAVVEDLDQDWHIHGNAEERCYIMRNGVVVYVIVHPSERHFHKAAEAYLLTASQGEYTKFFPHAPWRRK